MSATQTISIQKILVKHKFSEKEATEILEYVEKRKDKGIDRLWIAIGLGFGILALLIAGLWADRRSTRQELKQDMKLMESRIIKTIENKK